MPNVVIADWFCPIKLFWCEWWSLGGDTGSDLTLTDRGDVEGGGVLFDTAKCGKPLKKNNKKIN